MIYRGIIFTDHILQRMKERQISLDYVYWVFKRPEIKIYDRKKQSYKFIRQGSNKNFVMIAKQNEKKEWVLLSCWTKEIYLRKKPKRLNFWQNLWKILWS
ncbi:DUF4258 domain-containing protein [Candidatus Beckwithbacteria bacterium]|nr:DUF4258 domain-containing protein [Candidatus Beckwithbacteria bacterium]